jgi:hypothetical protein
LRASAHVAWTLARALAAISNVFTWEWATWWTAALLRFASTGEEFTVTRNDEDQHG